MSPFVTVHQIEINGIDASILIDVRYRLGQGRQGNPFQKLIFKKAAILFCQLTVSIQIHGNQKNSLSTAFPSWSSSMAMPVPT